MEELHLICRKNNGVNKTTSGFTSEAWKLNEKRLKLGMPIHLRDNWSTEPYLSGILIGVRNIDNRVVLVCDNTNEITTNIKVRAFGEKRYFKKT